jgi:hypothetical protein
LVFVPDYVFWRWFGFCECECGVVNRRVNNFLDYWGFLDVRSGVGGLVPNLLKNDELLLHRGGLLYLLSIGYQFFLRCRCFNIDQLIVNRHFLLRSLRSIGIEYFILLFARWQLNYRNTNS